MRRPYAQVLSYPHRKHQLEISKEKDNGKFRTSVVNTTQRIKTTLGEEAGYIGNPTNVPGLMRINITF
jgi:hypothetical protein